MLSDKVSKLRALLQRPSTPDARREASLKRIARRRRLLEKGTKALPWLSCVRAAHIALVEVVERRTVLCLSSAATSTCSQYHGEVWEGGPT